MSVRALVAQNPPLKPVLEAKLAERNLSVQKFLREFFGVDAKGKPKGAGTYYGWLKATDGLRASTKNRLGAFFNCPPEDFDTRKLLATKAPRKALKPRQTSDQPSLLDPPQEAPRRRAELVAEPVQAAPQFSFVVNAQGLCDLTMGLRNVSMDRAMRVLDTLKGAGLLGND